MKNFLFKFGFVVVIAAMALSYQNCTRVGFKETPQVEKASVAVEPLNCSFNGETVYSGESIVAYQNSSVDYGEVCASQKRLCDDGTLSGTFNYSTCAVGMPASCLFNGQTIASGQRIAAYLSSAVSYGETCQQEFRECQNGALSGSFNFATCEVGQPSSCLFNGKTIAHGEKAKGYKASAVPYGSVCESEDRVCTNGELSGNYTFGSCSVGQPNSCMFNGKTLAHGEKTKGYKTSSVTYGNVCQSEDRTCDNGTLSGSFQYGSCNVGQPSSCLFNGQTIAHGQSVVAYQNATVPDGSSCVSQNRTCNNGTLSGGYTNASCKVLPPACVPGNLTIKMVQKTSSLYCPYSGTPGVYIVNIATNLSQHIYGTKTLTASVNLPNDTYKVYLGAWDRHCWDGNTESTHNPNGACDNHNEPDEQYKIKIGSWTSPASTDIGAGQTLTSTYAGTRSFSGQLQITAVGADPNGGGSVMPVCVAFVKSCP